MVDESAGQDVKTIAVEPGSQRRRVMKQLSLDARADPAKSAYVANFRNSAFHYGKIRGSSPSGGEILLEVQTPNRRPIYLPLVMPKGMAAKHKNGELIKVMCTVVGGINKTTHESYTTFMIRSIERPNIFEAVPRNVIDLLAKEGESRRAFEDGDLINSGANNHVQLAGICVGSRFVEASEQTRTPPHAEIHLRQEGNEDSVITVRYFGPQAERAIEKARVGALLYCEGRHLVKSSPLNVVKPVESADGEAQQAEAPDVGMPMYVNDEAGNPVPLFRSFIRLTRVPEMADSKSCLFIEKTELTPPWVIDYAKQLLALRAARNTRSAAVVTPDEGSAVPEGMSGADV